MKAKKIVSLLLALTLCLSLFGGAWASDEIAEEPEAEEVIETTEITEPEGAPASKEAPAEAEEEEIPAVEDETEEPIPEDETEEPAPVEAEPALDGTSGTCGNNLTWTLAYFEGVLTISGTGTMRNYNAFDTPWDDYRLKVKSVVIDDGVWSISNYAFYECSNLTSVTIGNSVTSIGESAFYGCSNLTTITIGNAVTWIGDSAFYGCSSLTSVTIPNSVTNISARAFYGCSSLTSVTIPDGVTSISARAFYGCSSLTSVMIPDSVTSIGTEAFRGCSSLTSVTIPDGVTSIGESAFYGCSKLTSVTIPDSVTSIGKSAFYGCNSLTSVTIGNSVTSIGERAFYSCSSLMSVTIPDSLRSIGDFAFSRCSNLTNVAISISNNDINIGVGVFDDTPWCSAQKDFITMGSMLIYYKGEGGEVIIPNGVTHIHYRAFNNCTSLTNVTIPNGATSIDSSAFKNCTNLTSVTIPDSIVVIGSDAFAGCSQLESVIYAGPFADWKSIDIGRGNEPLTEAFKNTRSILDFGIGNDNLVWSLTADGKLTISGSGEMKNYKTYSSYVAPWYNYKDQILSVTLTDGVTSIGEYAFYGCSSLTNIEIPKSVSSIGTNAFEDCTDLCLEIDMEVIPSNSFKTQTGITEVHFGDSVTSIGDFAFQDCSNIKRLIFSEGISYIGEDAFRRCTSLETVTIPNSVSTLRTGAFWQCSGLRKVTLGNQISTIEVGTFSQCTSLTEINIPIGVTSIEAQGFYACSSLRTIVYTGTLDDWLNIEIGNYNEDLKTAYCTARGLLDCGVCGENLKYILDDEGLMRIFGTGAMEEYSSIYSVRWRSYLEKIVTIEIQDGVTSIEKFAFENCTNLNKIWLPPSLTSIGERAFKGCTGLVDVFYRGPDTGWIDMERGNSNDDLINAYKTSSGKLDYGTFGDNLYYVLAEWGELTIWGSGDMPDYESYTKTPWSYYRDKIQSVVIAYGVTSIGNYAFYGCENLTKLVIPDGITSIGERAFLRSALTELTIPLSITSIGDYAFSGCDKLTTIHFDGTKEQWEKIQIGPGNTPLQSWALEHLGAAIHSTTDNGLEWSVTKDGTLTISGNGEIEDYYWEALLTPGDKQPPWYEYRSSINSIVIGDGITHIGQRAFKNFGQAESLTLGAGLEGISRYAFYGCDALKGVYISDMASWCGISFFSGYAGEINNPLGSAHNLYLNGELQTDITIPTSVTRIEYGVFEGCSSLASVTIPTSVKEIGGAVFKECENLTDITIPESVTKIGALAFAGTPWLAAQGDMVIINHILYTYQGSAENVVIPDGVTSICSYAFANCKNLKSITIPASVTHIGFGAFEDCSLSDVYYSGTKEQWDTITTIAPADTHSMNAFDPDGNEGVIELLSGVYEDGPWEFSGYEDSQNRPLEKAELHYSAGSHTHSLTVVEAKAATYTETGNIKYWKCGACGKLFSDEKGEHEITQEDTILPKLTLPGDADGDGKVTVNDAAILLNEPEKAPEAAALLRQLVGLNP